MSEQITVARSAGSEPFTIGQADVENHSIGVDVQVEWHLPWRTP